MDAVAVSLGVLSGYLQRGRQPTMYTIHRGGRLTRSTNLTWSTNRLPTLVADYAAPTIGQFRQLRSAEDVLHQDRSDITLASVGSARCTSARVFSRIRVIGPR